MPVINERRVEPSDWDRAVAQADGPQLLVGGPGSGKTEFLVRRACWLFEEAGIKPEHVLLLSFSRRGVADLRRRVQMKLTRSITEVPASTFHSLASRILETHGERTLGWTRMPTLLTGPEQVALMHELLATEDPHRWPLPFRGMIASPSFAREVTDFLLRCQEQMIDQSDLAELAAERADWRALPDLFVRYREQLRNQNRIDYGTLLEQAVRILDRAEVARSTGYRYRYLLVDEYQDTTQAQVRLLQSLYARSRNLTASADPYQSIYSFRGADLSNVDRFPVDFPDAAGAPAGRLVLTTSFRVPAAILSAAERVTAGSLPGASGPVTPAAGKGRVEIYGFEQQTQEAEWIASEINRIHLEEQIPYGRIAVFVRSKRRFLPELSRVLERKRIPHDLPDSRLTDHPAVRLIVDCVLAATEPPPLAGRAIRRVLLGPLFSISLGRLRELDREMMRPGIGWPETISNLVEDGEGLATLLRDRDWATVLPAVQGFWQVWESLPQFNAVVHHPERRGERAAWASLAQVLGRLHERDPGATLADYVRLTQDEEFEARPLLSYRAPDGDRLTLTTLHQSKGLEFDTVFIADAVEGVFPDLRSRESLLGSRHLSPALPSDPAAYRHFRLQEEMRLAYTAMTRSYRRVVWTATSSGIEEGQGMPSRFLSLVAGTGTNAEAIAAPPARSNPVTSQEAEAWLRRILRDPAQSRVRRLASLSVLARGTAWDLRPPDSFAGVRRRGSGTGIIPSGFSLSPSQAESYAACPRRYVFEKRLHVGDDTTPFLTFGSLIHQVLERSERHAVDAGIQHAQVATALTELDELWDPSDFGGEPWATAWHRRAVAVLTYLYDRWPSHGVPVALERPLTLDIDGVTWHGTADRIELRDGAVKVVDYKTGSTVPRTDEAAISMQLAFYVLALGADPEAASWGSIDEAEFWYPARTETKKLTVRRFDPHQLPLAEEALRRTGAGISAERWPATPNPRCSNCRVRGVCPEWPEGREAFAS
jgi:superfamily I DNA/RNA helicase/RecB family exonuclease